MKHDIAMEATIRAILMPGKGILAADESTGTIEKRFKSINVESTETNRRDYREILFTTPGMADAISGVILFEETLFQKSRNGMPFVKILTDAGVVPGIKVDKGTVPLTEHPNELTTQGLNGLDERLKTYKAAGACFAKWRAVITIAPEIPTDDCIRANADLLARYAAICQENGLVPIVEPEILMDGDHTIEECAEATRRTLKTVFEELRAKKVSLRHMLLKPNMVLPGKKATVQATPEEIASATLQLFRKVIPAEMPGIAFLSGGQSDEEATANLNAMNAHGSQPWILTFSYGRALQAPALKAWAGKSENINAAQQVFLKRARLNGKAQLGKYNPDMERTYN